MTATSAQVREWANGDGGFSIGPRGNIPGHVRDAYDAAHPAPDGDDPSSFTDYPDDDFGTAFADEPEDTGETPPKKPRTSRSRASGGSGRPRFGFGRKKPGKKKPRIPVDDLISGAWGMLARLAAPMPPLQRTLRVQAPVAGLLLEDTVKNTAADVVLQPFARLASQGKIVSALLGPPIIVSGLTLHMMQAEQAGQDPNPVILSVGHEALRASLMTWMDVAGPKFEQALQREKEFEEKHGKSVDMFIDWLFSAAAAPGDTAAAQAEEEAIRRAQGIL